MAFGYARVPDLLGWSQTIVSAGGGISPLSESILFPKACFATLHYSKDESRRRGQPHHCRSICIRAQVNRGTVQLKGSTTCLCFLPGDPFFFFLKILIALFNSSSLSLSLSLPLPMQVHAICCWFGWLPSLQASLPFSEPPDAQVK